MTVKSKIIYWVMALFTIAFVIRIIGIISGLYEYTLDAELIEFTKCALGAAFGIETFTRIQKYLTRKK